MARRSIAERIAQLEARKKALQARLSKQERAVDTRRKVLLGALVLQRLESDNDPEFTRRLSDWLKRELPGFLIRENDRALFRSLSNRSREAMEVQATEEQMQGIVATRAMGSLTIPETMPEAPGPNRRFRRLILPQPRISADEPDLVRLPRHAPSGAARSPLGAGLHHFYPLRLGVHALKVFFFAALVTLVLLALVEISMEITDLRKTVLHAALNIGAVIVGLAFLLRPRSIPWSRPSGMGLRV